MLSLDLVYALFLICIDILVLCFTMFTSHNMKDQDQDTIYRKPMISQNLADKLFPAEKY